MKRHSKIAGIGLVAGLLCGAAYAEGFGGSVSLYGVAGAFADDLVDPDSGDLNGASFSGFGISGSLAYDFGSVALQGDLHFEDLSFDGQSSSNDTEKTDGATLHLYFPVGQYQVGAFYGQNISTHLLIDGDDAESVTWYGIEAATEMGDMQLAGQIGLASAANDHDDLDFTDQPFFSLRARYFASDDMMYWAGFGSGTGIIHDYEQRVVDLDLGVTRSFAGGRFIGYLGLGFEDSSGDDGSGSNTRITLGVTMPFGSAANGGLRAVYAATPMIAPTLPNRISASTAQYD